ncbi:hypothetical protein [Catenulispora pinisilvae]|uniref:hypothetical protein n=1 Tax=Catenulispora pinisilvae TaxID=2705253 RepID=UPI0018923F6C|nr:hypothetical protein [Catenulispora pinisilvae]
MPEQNAEAEQPSYELLTALAQSQRQTIAELTETVADQAALISQLEKAAASGRRWSVKKTLDTSRSYAGLGARVETILRLAQDEVEVLRKEAERTAAQIIADAQRDAEGLRAEARGEVS